MSILFWSISRQSWIIKKKKKWKQKLCHTLLEERGYFLLKEAYLGLWFYCVVGRSHYRGKAEDVGYCLWGPHLLSVLPALLRLLQLSDGKLAEIPTQQEGWKGNQLKAVYCAIDKLIIFINECSKSRCAHLIIFN